MTLPAFVASGTRATGSNLASGAGITPGIPAGTVAGDLLLATCCAYGTATVLFDTPAGWNKVFDFASGGGAFWRIATGGDAAPTFTSSSNTAPNWGAEAMIQTWRGTRKTNPWGANGGDSAFSGSAGANVVSFNGITTTAADSLYLAFGVFMDNASLQPSWRDTPGGTLGAMVDGATIVPWVNTEVTVQRNATNFTLAHGVWSLAVPAAGAVAGQTANVTIGAGMFGRGRSYELMAYSAAGAPGAWTNPASGQLVRRNVAITLGWGAATAGSEGTPTYKIELSNAAGSFSSPTTIATGVVGNSYAWTPSLSLPPGSSYQLRVRSNDGYVDSANTTSSPFIIPADGMQLFL